MAAAAGNTLAALLTVLPMLIGLYGFGFAFAHLAGFTTDLWLRCREVRPGFWRWLPETRFKRIMGTD